MIYLITGATGDVGSKVVERLIENGSRPRVFVRDANKARSRYGDQVEVFAGDLADGASLRTASLLGVTEWTRLEPSAARAGILDRDRASRANDDGYVEGVEKALGL